MTDRLGWTCLYSISVSPTSPLWQWLQAQISSQGIQGWQRQWGSNKQHLYQRTINGIPIDGCVQK